MSQGKGWRCAGVFEMCRRCTENESGHDVSDGRLPWGLRQWSSLTRPNKPQVSQGRYLGCCWSSVQTQTETYIHTYGHRDRKQTDRQASGQTDRDRQINKESKRKPDRQGQTYADRVHTNRHTSRHMGRKRQTDRHGSSRSSQESVASYHHLSPTTSKFSQEEHQV